MPPLLLLYSLLPRWIPTAVCRRNGARGVAAGIAVGAALSLMLAPALSSRAVAAPASTVDLAPAPVLAYLDLVSGPNHGGENDRGVYLSLFGKNFGSSGLGRAVRVYIGGVEVASYRAMQPARGRPDITQISVQIGALGDPVPGVPLPVKVVVNGRASTDALTFTVNPGKILFVDNKIGNDATAVAGDIKHPFRHVQTARLEQGAWGVAGAGDVIVMRSTGVPWTDRGYENFFLRVRDKSGSAPTGRPGSGPIGILGYPGEDVFISQPYDAVLERSGVSGGISAINGISFPGMGQWIVLANLRIESGGHDGPVNVEVRGNHWRVVNNDLSAATAVANPNAKAAGIAGNGSGQVWLGNRIHDIYCGPEGTGPLQHHGIYIDGEGDYEIAFNLIEHIPGGSGFQTYANGSNGSETIAHVHLHHNRIHGTGKHGINLADGSTGDFRVYNNIVSETVFAGLRFNSNQLHGARIYNNTFYGNNRSARRGYGAWMNDWNLPADALDLRNNIVVPATGSAFAGGTVGFAGSPGIITRNFWGGNARQAEFDLDAVSGRPVFRDIASGFALHPDSPAVGAGSPMVRTLVVDDYDLQPRPPGRAIDIGALQR